MEKHIFKYSRSTMMTTDWTVVIIALVTALGSWIIYHGDVTGGALVILIGCGMLVPLYLNAKLMLSTLCVDDEGIVAMAFGRTWKVMTWNSVREVRSLRWADPGFSKPTRRYYIRSISGDRFYLKKGGPIIFNETIIGFESLMHILDEKGRQYGFTVASLEK